VFLCFSALVASFKYQSCHNISSTSNKDLPGRIRVYRSHCIAVKGFVSHEKLLSFSVV